MTAGEMSEMFRLYGILGRSDGGSEKLLALIFNQLEARAIVCGPSWVTVMLPRRQLTASARKFAADTLVEFGFHVEQVSSKRESGLGVYLPAAMRVKT